MAMLYYESSFAHHGIKGQKWGVRRFQNPDGTLTKAGRNHYLDRGDRKEDRQIRRRISATGKNYRKTFGEKLVLEEAYNKESKDYEKAAGKIAITRGQKKKLNAELEERRKSLSDAGDKLKNKKADLEDAKLFYDRQVAKYKEHTDKILSKYGKDKVVSLSTKDYKLGKDFMDAMFGDNRTKETMANPGLTFTNFPVLGPSYARRFIAKQEAERRKENISKRAKEDSEKRY